MIIINQVYQRQNYKVYKADNCYILHNTDKDFQEGHTHLDSMKQARLLIQLSIEHRIPNHLSRYLLISLLRINEGEYAHKINLLIDNKKKKQVYYNRSI